MCHVRVHVSVMQSRRSDTPEYTIHSEEEILPTKLPLCNTIGVREERNTNIHSDSCKPEFKIPASHHPAVSAPESPFKFMDISPPTAMSALTS